MMLALLSYSPVIHNEYEGYHCSSYHRCVARLMGTEEHVLQSLHSQMVYHSAQTSILYGIRSEVFGETFIGAVPGLLGK